MGSLKIYEVTQAIKQSKAKKRIKTPKISAKRLIFHGFSDDLRGNTSDQDCLQLSG